MSLGRTATRATLTLAASSALVLAAATAAHAVPITITAGGQSTGTVDYTAHSDGVQFSVPGVAMGCESSDANSGNFTLGGHDTPAQIGVIGDVEFNNCLGPLNLPMSVTMNTTPWTVNADEAPVGGVTQGNVGAVDAHVEDVQDPNNPGAQCNFDVVGSASASFDNATQTLSVNEADDTLRVINVVGCFTLIPEDTPANFAADYVVSNDVGPVAIN